MARTYTDEQKSIRKQAKRILKMVDEIQDHPHCKDSFLFSIGEATKWINYQAEVIRGQK